MRPGLHRRFAAPPAPDSVVVGVAFWPDDQIQAFDSRRREFEARGLSRAAAATKAFAETKPAATSAVGRRP